MPRNSRWLRVEQIFHAALAMNRTERISFVQSACGGDEELREEIGRLLEQLESDPGFLEAPIQLTRTGVALEIPEPELTGQVLGRYEILRRLGAGGMADVYLAKDEMLGRQVALKFLTDQGQTASDTEAIAREVRAASALNHPNILTIYEVGHFGGDGILID